MKYKLLIIGLLCSISVQAQMKISAKNFEGTIWAASNIDSSFFLSDTIRVVRLFDKSSPNTDISKDVAGYFNGNDFVTMEFKKSGELVFLTTKVDSWSIIKKKGKYTWKFGKKNKF